VINVVLGQVTSDQNLTVHLTFVLLEYCEIQERARSATPTLMKVSILMMRPNKKGNRGARMARMEMNPRNRVHGRPLRQYEKV